MDPEEAKQTDPAESDGKPNQTLTKFQMLTIPLEKLAMKEQQASREKQASGDEISGSSRVVRIHQLRAKYETCVKMICENADILNRLEGPQQELFAKAFFEMHYVLRQTLARALAKCDDDELELEQKGKGQEPGLVDL